MKKNIDPIIVLSSLGVILLMGFLFIFVQFRQSPELLKKIGEQIQIGQAFKEVTVSIDYGNGKVKTFKGPIGESARVWDAFQQAIAAGGINVEISDHFIPEKIGGLKNGAEDKHWNLYVNDIRQKFSPFEIQVKPGDEVVFRFE